MLKGSLLKKMQDYIVKLERKRLALADHVTICSKLQIKRNFI